MLAAAGYRSEVGWTTYAWFDGSFDSGDGAPAVDGEDVSGPIAFVKGIGSSGDTGTIDDNCKLPSPRAARTATISYRSR